MKGPRGALLTWGFHNYVSDTSLFYSHKHGRMLLLLVYVDDILITGDSQADVQHVIDALHTQFALKTLGLVHYFLGFEVLRTPLGLHLSQAKYAADLLHKTNMAAAKPCSTPMCLSNNLSLSDSEPFSQPSVYRSIIGALQYLTLTRPDLAFCVNKLSQFLQTPTVAQWNACKRILRYVKGTLSHGLLFKPASLFTLEGYSDSDWATNIDDRKPVNGICVFLGGNLITWSSRKQKAVARSSTEAEYRALSSAATDLMWVKHLLTEIGIYVPQPLVLWSDNLGAQALACNPIYHARTKHIELDVHFIRNIISEHKLEVRHVPTESQPADILTNPLSLDRFQLMCSKLTMCAPMLSLRGHVEACDSAAPQDTSAASYYCVVHTPSDDKFSSGTSRISCNSCLSKVTQCTPTSGHALLTNCNLLVLMVHLKALKFSLL